jgi:hypothetical protein
LIVSIYAFARFGRESTLVEFLSFGGGVNSVATLLLLKPRVLIFADTGDEYPETYAYISQYVLPFVQVYGGDFVVVRNKTYKSLRDQAISERIIPVRLYRWCTDKWKIRPIREYLKRGALLPCVQMIAIDAGESHRARPSDRSEIINRFPLLERGLDRDDCLAIIEKHGWPGPPKSGCFYCPFQSKRRWIALKRCHPELFQIAVEMEKNGSNYGQLFLASDRPLEEYLKSGRIREDDAESTAALPCSCYDG